MNCTEFESLVVDIARGQMMDAAVRRQGLAHAETCGRCARRLANEQMLSGLVARVAVEDGGREAPPAVEKMLLAAFQQRGIASRQHRRAWLARAAAAAIAALLIVAAMVTFRKPPEPPAVQVKRLLPAPAAGPVKVIAPVLHTVKKPPARLLRAARRKPAPQPPAESVAGKREVMTDFIPVVYDPEPIERGRLVRVRLPRSALAAFGLPMNEQHADEPIKADVLLGEDGLARAVRFIK